LTKRLILDPCPRCGVTHYRAACVLGRCEDLLGYGAEGRGAARRVAPAPPRPDRPLNRSEIGRLGGRAAHESGSAHEWTPEEARVAGRKGGLATSSRSVLSVIRQLVQRETESLAVRALMARKQGTCA